MKNIVKGLLILCVVMTLATGCAKKPKLYLAGLRDNQQELNANKSGQPGGDYSFQTDDPNAAKLQPGQWGPMDSPVGGADAAGENPYIKDAKSWNEKVYFDYNRYEIKASQRPVLDKLYEFLNQNGTLALVIEGHCDERGSEEYNRSLSERRALAIRDYLNTLGIDNARMFTISYGVDRPEIPNAKTETEHAKNRRGQFLTGTKK